MSAASTALAMSARTRQMLHAPLLPTLLRLATPNVIGLFAMTIVIGYDGFILGRLGPDALAGIALVFPLSMLMLQMSAGGIGGASTAAVARALGAGRHGDADGLAQHALLIAFAMAGLFMVVMLGFGRAVYGAMGGRGAALDAALAYSNVLFLGRGRDLVDQRAGRHRARRGQHAPAFADAAGHGARSPRAVSAAGVRLGSGRRSGHCRRGGQHADGQWRGGRGDGSVSAATRRRGAPAPVAVALSHEPRCATSFAWACRRR